MSNIKEIKLMNQKEIYENFGVPIPEKSDGFPLSTLVFKGKQEFTTMTINELLLMLKLWIQAEEMRYPLEKGFKGRWLLFDKIKEVFENE